MPILPSPMGLIFGIRGNLPLSDALMEIEGSLWVAPNDSTSAAVPPKSGFQRMVSENSSGQRTAFVRSHFRLDMTFPCLSCHVCVTGRYSNNQNPSHLPSLLHEKLENPITNSS